VLHLLYAPSGHYLTTRARPWARFKNTILFKYMFNITYQISGPMCYRICEKHQCEWLQAAQSQTYLQFWS
jgi:hypothetical protein